MPEVVKPTDRAWERSVRMDDAIGSTVKVMFVQVWDSSVGLRGLPVVTASSLLASD